MTGNALTLGLLIHNYTFLWMANTKRSKGIWYNLPFHPEGDYKKQFEGHLKSEDFLGVDKYETATLVFKKIKTKSKQNYMVTGDLTIKGITKSITFNLLVSSNFAKTTVVVDRTNYNIKYGSGSFFAGLGDKAISDEFNLDVSLNW